MKNAISITAVLFTLTLFSCNKNKDTTTPQPLIDDRSIDSFNVNLQPIGAGSGSGFNEFGVTAVGYLSLFKKGAYERGEAKANYNFIDLVYYINPSNGGSNNGTVKFSNPTVLNGGLGPNFNLGWLSYPDKPQFIDALKSQLINNASGGYLNLNEEEFDKIVTPEQIHGVITHSLKNTAEKKSYFDIHYFASKTESIAIFGMLDTEGRESIIKIKPDQPISQLFIKVKRAYSN